MKRDDSDSLTFPQRNRIKHQQEFQEVFREGVRVGNAYLRLMWCTQPTGEKRLGISASRRIGNAVTRNRLKRLTREFFRLNRSLFPQGDIIVIIGYRAGSIDNSSYRHHLKAALYQLCKICQKVTKP